MVKVILGQFWASCLMVPGEPWKKSRLLQWEGAEVPSWRSSPSQDASSPVAICLQRPERVQVRTTQA